MAPIQISHVFRLEQTLLPRGRTARDIQLVYLKRTAIGSAILHVTSSRHLVNSSLSSPVRRFLDDRYMCGANSTVLNRGLSTL
jgi:hypothetical protein